MGFKDIKSEQIYPVKPVETNSFKVLMATTRGNSCIFNRNMQVFFNRHQTKMLIVKKIKFSGWDRIVKIFKYNLIF
jgi:hypothetical protein